MRRLLFSVLTFFSAAFCSAAPADAQPRPFHYAEGAFSIDIRNNEVVQALLEIQPGQGKLKSSFTVDKPARLVIDFGGLKLSQNRTLKVGGAGLIAAVRIGVHADIVRIVVDCKGDSPPEFGVDTSSGAVRIQLKKPESAQPVATAVSEISPQPSPTAAAPVIAPQPEASKTAEPPRPTVTPRPTRTPPPTRTPNPTAIPKPTVTPKPTRTPIPVSTPSPLTPSSSSQPTVNPAAPTPLSGDTVTEIRFGYEGEQHTPTIELGIHGKPDLRMTKVDDQRYEIDLSGFSLSAPYLALAQFPPQDFRGITFVKADAESGGVRITVGVDRGIRLSALLHENQIWIRPQD